MKGIFNRSGKCKCVYQYSFFMYEAISVEYFLLYLLFVGAYTLEYVISRSIPLEVFLATGILSFFIFLFIPRKVVVCENGMFIGKFFVPWERIEKVKCSGNKIVLKVRGYPLSICIKRNLKVERILKEKVRESL